MTRLLRYRHDGLTFDVRDEGPLDADPVVLLHWYRVPTQEPQAVADAVLSRVGSVA